MQVNFERFLSTLPIIGTSLLGIFAATIALILIVYILNALSSPNKKDGNNE